MITNYHSYGKLLLTAEYVILDGALGLALPTVLGQSMTTEPSEKGSLNWESRDADGKIWMSVTFDLNTLTVSDNSKEGINILQGLLKSIKKQRPELLSGDKGYKVVTTLEFPRFWGLGSSSTLVNNMAKWASVDPYQLQHEVLGGSGYDIACARLGRPLLYQIRAGAPVVLPVTFYPPFGDHLYFVYLNKKQNSRDAIQAYKMRQSNISGHVDRISDITRAVVAATSLKEFEVLLTEHETVLSALLGIPTMKDSQFPDFPGAIKSLGAWGGDFIMATGGPELVHYFNIRGYTTVLPFRKLVAQPLDHH